MPVFSATAIQISGVNTPSMSKVTIDCFTAAECFKTEIQNQPRSAFSNLTTLTSLTATEAQYSAWNGGSKLVAQICNLTYRRFAIGWAFEMTELLAALRDSQNAIL